MNRRIGFLRGLMSGATCLLMGGSEWFVAASQPPQVATSDVLHTYACQGAPNAPNFLVVAGGGAPGYNEIALEKNVLYFQRTLTAMGYDPASASIFFANGNDGQATIRYVNDSGRIAFKVPEIPYLQGAATLGNLLGWLQQTASQSPQKPLFFYFTGHGLRNPQDDNNNALILWEEALLTVRDLSNLLDEMPQEMPVVTMMVQCFSGSFANFVHEGGDPSRPLALQTRCGFFATVKTRPSVGCTPLVNEADYEDYSSSFFAGLSGRSRTGEAVPSADYDRDGTVSFAEAHAFAKVDEETTDYPISTSESWLRQRASSQTRGQILAQPIAEVMATARPEQRYVVDALMQRFQFDPQRSYTDNAKTLARSQVDDPVKSAYLVRLWMELVNVGMEQRVRGAEDKGAIADLNRLLDCEARSW